RAARAEGVARRGLSRAHQRRDHGRHGRVMEAFLHQLRVTLRLHFRNRMALIYSYLFPTIFLIAFWVLYRYDRVPLARHMGELLTVTALGGACFGLPTTLRSEERRVG